MGRNRSRTEDQGQRTAFNKPVPRLPSPVRLSAISYQLPTTDYKLGGLTPHQRSAKRQEALAQLSPFTFELSAIK